MLNIQRESVIDSLPIPFVESDQVESRKRILEGGAELIHTPLFRRGLLKGNHRESLFIGIDIVDERGIPGDEDITADVDRLFENLVEMSAATANDSDFCRFDAVKFTDNLVVRFDCLQPGSELVRRNLKSSVPPVISTLEVAI